MKRIFAVVLAVVMILPLSLTALAATTVTYPVGGLSSVGFLADDDGVVDLDTPVTSKTPVSYGKTVYYPLLNTGSEGAAAGDEELEKAQKALEAAQKAYDDAVEAYDNAAAAAKDAKAAYEEAEKALKGNTSELFAKAETALNEYNTAKKTLEDAQKKLNDAKSALSSKQSDLKAAQNQKAALDKLTDAVIESRIASRFPKPATATDIPKANIPSSVFPETTAVGSAYTISLTNVTLAQAKTQIRAKVDAAAKACDSKINSAQSAVDNAQKAIDNAQDDVKTKTTAFNSKKKPLQNRLDVINNLFSPALTLNAETVTASELAAAKKKTPNSSDLTAARDKAKAASEAADKAEASAKSTMEAKKKALDEAQAAYDEASKAADDNYRFVTESSAVSSAKVTTSWSSGKKYIKGASIVRKTAYSTVYSLNGSTKSLGGSTNKIYFVAIETQASGTKHESNDADGTIKVKKSGSNGFSIENDVSLWLEYQYADNSGVIPKNPTLFDQDDGFDTDEEYTFYFEDDDDSYFVVNTKHQKEILLAFDTEYDDKIADRVEKSNPEADLDFYNGNYARFNRTGKLYLSYPDKKGYVYAISSSGNITQVTNAKYDSSEEAFVISTNVLGRYMISNEKLKIVDEGDSSSSSTTSSASVSPVTPPAPTTPPATTSSRASTYSYTPAPQSSSRPASSSQPSSSSAPSSSEPSSESSSSSKESSSSSKESSSYEDVLVKEPTSNSEVPTKSKGVSWLVWGLILAGLAAILIAVGVVFYTHRNSGDRML